MEPSKLKNCKHEAEKYQTYTKNLQLTIKEN